MKKSFWVLPLATASLVLASNAAWADVPNSPGAKCKCSTPGGEAAGAVTASISAIGLAAALLLRKRKKG